MTLASHLSKHGDHILHFTLHTDQNLQPNKTYDQTAFISLSEDCKSSKAVLRYLLYRFVAVITVLDLWLLLQILQPVFADIDQITHYSAQTVHFTNALTQKCWYVHTMNWLLWSCTHIHFNFATDDKPSLPTLLKFPGKHENINIPEQIGTNYKTFGTLLLKDDSGMIISSIEKAKLHNATEINATILQKWIGGKGREPFTWNTLVNCLRDAELNVLANDIEEVLHR